MNIRLTKLEVETILKWFYTQTNTEGTLDHEDELAEKLADTYGIKSETGGWGFTVNSWNTTEAAAMTRDNLPNPTEPPTQGDKKKMNDNNIKSGPYILESKYFIGVDGERYKFKFVTIYNFRENPYSDIYEHLHSYLFHHKEGYWSTYAPPLDTLENLNRFVIQKIEDGTAKRIMSLSEEIDTYLEAEEAANFETTPKRLDILIDLSKSKPKTLEQAFNDFINSSSEDY